MRMMKLSNLSSSKTKPPICKSIERPLMSLINIKPRNNSMKTKRMKSVTRKKIKEGDHLRLSDKQIRISIMKRLHMMKMKSTKLSNSSKRTSRHQQRLLSLVRIIKLKFSNSTMSSKTIMIRWMTTNILITMNINKNDLAKIYSGDVHV